LRDSGRRTTVTALAIMCVMFIPQRLLKPLDSSALLQFRVLVLLGLIIWLFVLSADVAQRNIRTTPALRI
jgi:hypothetical protein